MMRVELATKVLLRFPLVGNNLCTTFVKAKKIAPPWRHPQVPPFSLLFFKGLDISKITIIVGSLIGFKLTKIDKRMSQFP